MSSKNVICALMLTLGAPNALLAQATSEPAPDAAEPVASERSEAGSRFASYGAGMAAGAAGFVIGGLLGASLADNCDGFSCFDEGLWGGAVLGSIGLGTGVHLGNGSRGDIWLTLLTSLGIGLGGTGLAIAIDDDPGSGIVLIGTLVIQLIAVTEVERASGRSRVREQNARDSGLSLGLSPTIRQGEVGLALAGRLSF